MLRLPPTSPLLPYTTLFRSRSPSGSARPRAGGCRSATPGRRRGEARRGCSARGRAPPGTSARPRETALAGGERARPGGSAGSRLSRRRSQALPELARGLMLWIDLESAIHVTLRIAGISPILLDLRQRDLRLRPTRCQLGGPPEARRGFVEAVLQRDGPSGLEVCMRVVCL